MKKKQAGNRTENINKTAMKDKTKKYRKHQGWDTERVINKQDTAGNIQTNE